jgi:protein-S-isoprenylcysteine O-methyltransferase Ste14
MRRSAAAAASSLFFLLAPGVVAGVVPWWLVGWRVRPIWAPLRFAGAVLIVAGLPVLVDAFRRFVREGKGTPAPIAPTEELVVGGPYRYVRNPMYLAVLAVIVGQAFLLGQLSLLVYAAVVGAAFAAFVRFYEEPILRRRYGAQYETYQRSVRAWCPRLRPWTSAS